MKIRFKTVAHKLVNSELLFGLAFDGVDPDLGSALASAVRDAKATGDLDTSWRKVRVFHPNGKTSPKRLGFVGMGGLADVDRERLRRAAALAQARAEDFGVETFELELREQDCGEIPAFDAGRAIAEGLVLGAYRYQAPSKTKPEPRHAQRATVRYSGEAGARFQKGLKTGIAAAEATVFARDIENQAGNLATPSHLAAAARRLGKGRIKVRVLGEVDMKRLKMEALLGVSRGSKQPAKLIVLDYKPASVKRTVCIVGKGLTFDSGGISIKPSAKMDEMRYDMCGGGAVLGLFHALGNGGIDAKKGNTRVVGIVPSSENMPDAEAQKPGDVVTACDGTTIEVLNTDAEGRLILADALAYAVKTFKPQRVVDLATLTGAVVVALGHEVAAVMGDDELCAELKAAGEAADEPIWQLPLWDVHKEQCKSRFADVANINSPAHGNGSINGGAFLSHFVGDTTKWAHLDIAGTAWGGIAKDYYRNGASGTMVRMLLEWVRALG